MRERQFEKVPGGRATRRVCTLAGSAECSTHHAAGAVAVHGVHKARVVGLDAGRRELLLAHEALAARDVEASDYAVADLEVLDAWADGLDDTHALVAEAARKKGVSTSLDGNGSPATGETRRRAP